MKWKAVLSAVVIGVTSFGITPMQAVSAERENYKCEIPIVGSLYVYSGANKNHYYEIDMSMSVEITGKGDFVYTIYSQEDFQICVDTTLDIYTQKIAVDYSIPEYIPDYAFFQNCSGNGTVIKNIGNSNFELNLRWDMGRNMDKSADVLLSIYPKHSYKGVTHDVVSFKKGETLGEFVIKQTYPFFCDEENRCFEYDGTRHYVDVEQPTYGLVLDGNNVSRTLTNESVLSELSRNPTGDFNKDGAFSISDLVLLQKWLLGESVLKTYNLDWQAANFCEDDRLDVFDLCLMRRALIEK